MRQTSCFQWQQRSIISRPAVRGHLLHRKRCIITVASMDRKKLLQLRNSLRDVGASDEQADLAVSEFVPTFTLLESTEKVLEKLGKLDKLEVDLKALKTDLEATLQIQLYQIVTAGAFIGLVAGTSPTWLPVLLSLLK
ncbi:hypothetical protein Vafri_5222 [Volvox africanus]|uniref:Uncharacterized protein n=1 Tax=Volvox africanus TaxID=51714 RepID=A0A8J4EVJ8_9CHLO|nr:hypothetical protein Vafri_5222 [Volvox africanus]